LPQQTNECVETEGGSCLRKWTPLTSGCLSGARDVLHAYAEMEQAACCVSRLLSSEASMALANSQP